MGVVDLLIHVRRARAGALHVVITIFGLLMITGCQPHRCPLEDLPAGSATACTFLKVEHCPLSLFGSCNMQPSIWSSLMLLRVSASKSVHYAGGKSARKREGEGKRLIENISIRVLSCTSLGREGGREEKRVPHGCRELDL